MTCPATAASCHCVLTEPHEVHACDPEKCGGQWTGSDTTGDMHPVLLPHLRVTPEDLTTEQRSEIFRRMDINDLFSAGPPLAWWSASIPYIREDEATISRMLEDET